MAIVKKCEAAPRQGRIKREVVVLPDPGVVFGPLRILPQRGGFWLVYDERAPLGERTVFVARSRRVAEEWMYRHALDDVGVGEDS